MTVFVDGDGAPRTLAALVQPFASRVPIRFVVSVETGTNWDWWQAHGLFCCPVADAGENGVDQVIANHCAPGDLVLARDYGLAMEVARRGGLFLNYERLPQEQIGELLRRLVG